MRERERKKKRNVFFFKQKTAYEIKECDWSSDVCSSDLLFMVAINDNSHSAANFLSRLCSLGDILISFALFI